MADSKGKALVKKLLASKAVGGAPHITEFVECLVRQFGGAEACAVEMKLVYDAAPASFKLRFWSMFWKAVEVNTELGGTNNNFDMASEDELVDQLREILIKGGQALVVE